MEGRRLAATATARYAVSKRVVVLHPDQVNTKNLPPVLAETLPHLPELHSRAAFAVVCKGTSCLPPASDPEKLLEALNSALLSAAPTAVRESKKKPRFPSRGFHGCGACDCSSSDSCSVTKSWGRFDSSSPARRIPARLWRRRQSVNLLRIWPNQACRNGCETQHC